MDDFRISPARQLDCSGHSSNQRRILVEHWDVIQDEATEGNGKWSVLQSFLAYVQESDGWNEGIKNMQPSVTMIIAYQAGRHHVGEERPIYGCRAHHGCPRLLPRRGNLLGDPGRQCERRSHLRSKIAL